MEYFPIERVTGMAIINSMQLNNLRWRIMPANQILHKCFLLPFGDNGDRVIYEMKDSNIRSRLLEPGYPGCVQPWLERGDIVLVMFEMTGTSCRKAIVRGVNKQQKKVKLGFLIQDTSTQEWVVEREDDTWWDWDICIKVLEGFSMVHTSFDHSGEFDDATWIFQT